MKKLFDGAIKFKEEDFNKYQNLYQNLKQNQNPHTLFITCVDSRIVPNLITNTLPGELFVIRNMGNIIPPYRENSNIREGFLATTSAIEYALNVLNIANIIICGHSDCAACSAIYTKSEFKNTPYIYKWIELLEPIKNRVEKLKPQSKLKRTWLSEQINIEYQMENLITYPFVEERFNSGALKIYGWYYIIETGDILNFNIKKREFEVINRENQKSKQKKQKDE